MTMIFIDLTSNDLEDSYGEGYLSRSGFNQGSVIPVLVRIIDTIEQDLGILAHVPLNVDLETEVKEDLDLTKHLVVKFHVKIPLNN